MRGAIWGTLALWLAATPHGALASKNCTDITSWMDLKNYALLQEATSKVVCPFKVTKPGNESLVVEKPIKLTCLIPSSCVVEGSGNHIEVKGLASMLSLVGFVFQGATEAVVRIKPTARNYVHLIQNCIFRYNVGSLTEWRGGAIKTEPGARLVIIQSRFVDNQAVGGGAIFHRGDKLTLYDCVFKGNRAKRGGAIFLDANTSVLMQRARFIDNIATVVGWSGAIITSDASNVEWDTTVVASNNGKCNGIWETITGECIPFNRQSHNVASPSFMLGNLTTRMFNLWLSHGLTVRILARAGEPIAFESPEAPTPRSILPFHVNPDGAALFLTPGSGSPGYSYVSNSEVDVGGGGVYALDFDSEGRTKGYRQMLNRTSRNCNGGVTPWNTWVSCEEVVGGQCWEVDPSGSHEPARTILGGTTGGHFEAVACDNRNVSYPIFFLTEDAPDGAVRRFRPATGVAPGWGLLHADGGNMDYLEILDNHRFRWTPLLASGRTSALNHFQYCEGLAFFDGKLFFVAKRQKQLFQLNLDQGTYTVVSTFGPSLQGGGRFEAEPDQLVPRPVGSGWLMYMTEDGGLTPGVFVYDGSSYRALFQAASGTPFDYDETTGIVLSPDGRTLYVCIQSIGYLLEVRRLDGLAFPGA